MTTKENASKRRNQHPPVENNGIYEIKIKGLLDEHWAQWFEGMAFERVENEETGYECTLITGAIADQPALHGLLAKIRDLNLTLLSVYRINAETNSREEAPLDIAPGIEAGGRAKPDETGSGQK